MALAGYAGLVVLTFGLVLALVQRTWRELGSRISQLSGTMRRLTCGDLETEIPAVGCADELGEMTGTLESFKASLIERERLAVDQAAASAALLDEKERLRVTLHSIGDGMIVTDAAKTVTMMNGAAESLTGRSLVEARGQVLEDVLTLTYAEAQPESLEAAVARRAIRASGDATLIRPDGTELAVDVSTAMIFGQDSGTIGSITVLHDVTESRMLLKRVRHLAHFDTLTGLPNRALFHDRLAQTLRSAERTSQRCALLFLDMDRFKHVNDTLGHAVGDLLLREVAERLRLTVRASDTVARLGGDEFVVIIGDMDEAAAVALVAKKILESVAQIGSIAGHDIDVSFSIGIAIYPDDALDVDDLLMRADAAMYQAKDSGRNVRVFFDPDMDKVTQRRVQMRLRLARVLQLDQFALLYQPKIDLESGRITGAEALIRWYPEPGHQVSPVDFIPIAEETGLILPIDNWVLHETCRKLRAWAEDGLPAVPVSVNVSMKSLHCPTFVATSRLALEDSLVAPQALELEITESTAMSDPEHTFAILSAIRALGIRVSIDDFGTGFSSLSHLRKLPIDTIKIAHPFVKNMMEFQDDAALVNAIVKLATAMRKHVIAEGVETEAQRELLLRFGCREAQGFLFSKPVEPAVFATLLDKERSAFRLDPVVWVSNAPAEVRRRPSREHQPQPSAVALHHYRRRFELCPSPNILTTVLDGQGGRWGPSVM